MKELNYRKKKKYIPRGKTFGFTYQNNLISEREEKMIDVLYEEDRQMEEF